MDVIQGRNININADEKNDLSISFMNDFGELLWNIRLWNPNRGHEIIKAMHKAGIKSESEVNDLYDRMQEGVNT